ncbi:hypothetical protein M9H77_35792 [Catharanthus roseus]|uniref:Uncharacterized protein n=1 Tax=Catharanthus roseus TaxID=4058 RepID=A0ACB9ZU85_CATRO|nr:hypothetical protein M9H77_35792 [Catharanthus roseus]
MANLYIAQSGVITIFSIINLDRRFDHVYSFLRIVSETVSSPSDSSTSLSSLLTIVYNIDGSSETICVTTVICSVMFVVSIMCNWNTMLLDLLEFNENMNPFLRVVRWNSP